MRKVTIYFLLFLKRRKSDEKVTFEETDLVGEKLTILGGKKGRKEKFFRRKVETYQFLEQTFALKRTKKL